MVRVSESAENMMKDVNVDAKKWNRMPSDNEIAAAKDALEKHGINVIMVDKGEHALQKIRELIPNGAEVMNGSSTTLNEIGFVRFLQDGKHGWKNLHNEILAEKDQGRQSDLRRKAVTAEHFLSSVNAISQTGELVSCDASGSRVGAMPFAAKNIIFVSGVNKIVPTLNDAIERIRKYAFPLENARAKKAYGMNSNMSKMVVIAYEFMKGRITLILIKENLGY